MKIFYRRPPSFSLFLSLSLSLSLSLFAKTFVVFTTRCPLVVNRVGSVSCVFDPWTERTTVAAHKHAENRRKRSSLLPR